MDTFHKIVVYAVFALVALLGLVANAEETFSLEARYLSSGQSYGGAKMSLDLGALSLRGTTGILVHRDGSSEGQYRGEAKLGLFNGFSLQAGAVEELGNQYGYGGIELQVLGRSERGLFSSGHRHTRRNSWY